jgi:ankyrin repeat protein
MAGHAACVSALLTRADRACINAQDTDGNSPLLLAARYGHLAIVKALIAAKADLLVVNKAGHKASDAARQSADGVSARNILKVNKKAAADTVEVLIEAEIDAMP